MAVRWTNRAWYISPGKGKLVKITLTYERTTEEKKDTSVSTPKIKQEIS